MLKITSIVIGLLTAVTMASNAQAMPAEIHAQSFQRPTQTTNGHNIVVANNREQSEYRGSQEVEHRRLSPVRAESPRQYHRSHVVYQPQHRRFRGHQDHVRHHSNIRYYR